jgi:hypothetical protein
MAPATDSALVLLRSLWNKHVLLRRGEVREQQQAVVRKTMGSPITVSGYAVQAQCEIAAKHVEAVLRATLADFHDQVRHDHGTRRYVRSGDARKHLEAMLEGEARIAFGGLGGQRHEADFTLASGARRRTLLQLEGVVESELALVAHKLDTPPVDRKFWTEKRWAIAATVLMGVAGWVAKTVADSPAGQRAVTWVLHALRLK